MGRPASDMGRIFDVLCGCGVNWRTGVGGWGVPRCGGVGSGIPSSGAPGCWSGGPGRSGTEGDPTLRMGVEGFIGLELSSQGWPFCGWMRTSFTFSAKKSVSVAWAAARCGPGGRNLSRA